MARVSDCDWWDTEQEENLAMGRQTAALKATVNGKRGREVLRQLHTALLALPEKRLVYGSLACGGNVCVLGALLAYDAGVRENLSWVEAIDRFEGMASPHEAEELVKPLGMTPTLAADLYYANDEAYVTTLDDGVFNPIEDQERRRYRIVLRHVEELLKGL